MILLYHNAWLHTTKAWSWKLSPAYVRKFSLMHPPSSPNLATSNYCLFRSLQHHLSDSHFWSSEEAKKSVELFRSKSPYIFWNKIWSYLKSGKKWGILLWRLGCYSFQQITKFPRTNLYTHSITIWELFYFDSLNH